MVGGIFLEKKRGQTLVPAPMRVGTNLDFRRVVGCDLPAWPGSGWIRRTMIRVTAASLARTATRIRRPYSLGSSESFREGNWPYSSTTQFPQVVMEWEQTSRSRTPLRFAGVYNPAAAG